MPLNGYGLWTVCVNRMLTTFPQQIEAIFFEVSYQITTLYRHLMLLPAVVQEAPRQVEFLYLVVDMPIPFHVKHL